MDSSPQLQIYRAGGTFLSNMKSQVVYGMLHDLRRQTLTLNCYSSATLNTKPKLIYAKNHK
jgi:hypothetical protein